MFRARRLRLSDGRAGDNKVVRSTVSVDVRVLSAVAVLGSGGGPSERNAGRMVRRCTDTQPGFVVATPSGSMRM